MAKEKVSQDEINLRQNPVNEFTCCDKARSLADHRTHLTEDHKLNADQLKGNKSMLMHMDGDYWFSYQWQWQLESGLRFTQYTKQARSQDDPMRQ